MAYNPSHAALLLGALDTILQSTSDMIFIKDENLNYVAASACFCAWTRLAPDESLTDKTDFDLFDDELAYRYVRDDRHLLATGVDIIDHVEPMPIVDGKKSYCATSKHLLRNANGEVTGLLGISRDVTAQVELDELRVTSEIDVLTGILNRRSVLEQISAFFEESPKGSRFALIFLDLDCFKSINDRYGHLTGDKILAETARHLTETFGKSAIIGRLGGDEFLLLLRDAPTLDVVRARVARLLQLKPSCQLEDGFVVVATCSIGVTIARSGVDTFEQLYTRADQAMYRAKQSGKNRLAFYEDFTTME